MKHKPAYHLYFFILLSAIFPFVDFLNGYFLTTGVTLPIGVIYRIVFCLFLVVMIVLHPIPKTSFTLMIFAFILGNTLIWILQGIILQNPFSWMMADMAVLMKYFLWVFIPYYIYQYKNVFQMFHLNRLFIWINLLFTLELLIPYLLGVGTHTYSASDAGYKGFFYAQNDISCAFMILITTAGAKLLRALEKSGKWVIPFLLLYVGNFFCLLLIGTKTGVVYGAVVTIVMFIQLLSGRYAYSLLRQIFIWLMSSLALFLILFRGIKYAVDMLSGTMERMTYFYHLYNGNLVRLLTSSRSEFLEGGVKTFLGDHHLHFTLFFGQGFQYRAENFGRLGLIEMDFFDVFFAFGILGLFLLLMMVGYFVWLAMRKNQRSIYSYLLIVTLLYSFFAGHVFFSAESSTFLGFICGGILLRKQHNKNEIVQKES